VDTPKALPGTAEEKPTPIQCPSAHPAMPGSAVLGVVLGTIEQPRVSYLIKVEAVTQSILDLAAPVSPTRVFRFAAPCAGRACHHFDGTNCQLVSRIVEHLPSATDVLPECAIRSSCRWWRQEGAEACHRCPLIATESFGAAEFADSMRVAAIPRSGLVPLPT
jgi:hypothetical protein